MKIAELEATVKMYEFQLNQPENQTDPDKALELTGLYEKRNKSSTRPMIHGRNYQKKNKDGFFSLQSAPM